MSSSPSEVSSSFSSSSSILSHLEQLDISVDTLDALNTQSSPKKRSPIKIDTQSATALPNESSNNTALIHSKLFQPFYPTPRMRSLSEVSFASPTSSMNSATSNADTKTIQGKLLLVSLLEVGSMLGLNRISVTCLTSLPM